MADLARQWRNRFAALTDREQLAALLLGIALVVVLGYVAVFRPAWQHYHSAKAALVNARAVVAWLHEHEVDLRRAGAQADLSAAAGAGGEQSLVARLSATAADHQIAIARLEPHADGVRVWLEGSEFSRLLGWLDALRNDHRVVARDAVIDRNPGNPGQVAARLELAAIAN